MMRRLETTCTPSASLATKAQPDTASETRDSPADSPDIFSYVLNLRCYQKQSHTAGEQRAVAESPGPAPPQRTAPCLRRKSPRPRHVLVSNVRGGL